MFHGDPDGINDIREIFRLAIKDAATDIHFVVGHPPVFRINGELIASDGVPLDSESIRRLMYRLLTPEQIRIFEATMELDCSYHYFAEHYCRINLHVERGNIAGTIRILPSRIRSAKELGLPSPVMDLARKRRGLILICGPAGSGKTTTLTYMLDQINRERRCKIVTIEDPIEFIHQSKKSLIIQREVGTHTKSFASGLKHALRQDPDVVVIGEIRDLESIAMALTTAETGHLVLTTIHSPDAIESLNRIIDVYPSGKQNQIRVQLAETLAGIIGQNLLPRSNGTGRVLNTEILAPTLAIRNVIRRGAFLEIRGHMEGSEVEGMQTMEQSLSALANQGIITYEVAKEYAKHPKLLQINPS